MKTETITWHELPADGLPDADLTVLMQVNDCDGLPATEVWQGWWTGDDWLDAATAMPVARHLVRAWSDMPVGVLPSTGMPQTKEAA